MTPSPLLTARVHAIHVLCEGVVGIDLRPDDETSRWPAAEPGAHVDVHLASGLVRQYSIYAALPEGRGYCIAVQRDAASRGGSEWIHDNVKAGDAISISVPRHGFPLVEASRYLFIAGGIGITPLVSMLRAVRERHVENRLFYCTRNAQRTPFRDLLAATHPSSSVELIHDDGDPARGLDVVRTIGPFDAQTHLYCCGPNGLMAAVKQSAVELGWPETHLHFEHFVRTESLPDASFGAFRIRIASTNDVYDVGPDETVLDVLREHDFLIDSSCEQGLCGTCRVGVLEGIVDHRDEVLATAEKEANSAMTVCCSRALSAELVLDL